MRNRNFLQGAGGQQVQGSPYFQMRQAQQAAQPPQLPPGTGQPPLQQQPLPPPSGGYRDLRGYFPPQGGMPPGQEMINYKRPGMGSEIPPGMLGGQPPNIQNPIWNASPTPFPEGGQWPRAATPLTPRPPAPASPTGLTSPPPMVGDRQAALARKNERDLARAPNQSAERQAALMRKGARDQARFGGV